MRQATREIWKAYRVRRGHNVPKLEFAIQLTPTHENCNQRVAVTGYSHFVEMLQKNI
jgi:hypothetical protein